MDVRSGLDRFNAAHPWSHNDVFSGFVLRHARAVRRRGGRRVVDVGCGGGALLVRLARVVPEALGIEPDPDSARIASTRLADEPGVRIENRPFGGEASDSCDLMVFVASLHHMPLEAALREARRALRPGGLLVVVGVARETARDTARSLVSAALNPLVGLVRHPARAAGAPTRMQAPTADPRESFEEIREVARRVLPGVCMRRRLFWRYTAVWAAPA